MGVTLSAMSSLATPVLLLIFNRPDKTRRAFEEIRKARPAQLYVAADGPRAERAGEAARCQATRDLVTQVDWECEVHVNFRERHLGLKRAVSTGIDWFFEHVEEGIILEDDCVASLSFFSFCETLLTRYRDDRRIMQISGNNFLFGRQVADASYYFSKLNDIWGWATWKRAWELCDLTMKTYPLFKEQRQLENYIDDYDIRKWLMSYFEEAYNSPPGEGLWSSAWVYAMCVHNGLTIVPRVNLVANIGLSSDGTNTGESFGLYSTAECDELGELIHPPFILPNREADAMRFEAIRKTDPRLMARGSRIRDLAERLFGGVRA